MKKLICLLILMTTNCYAISVAHISAHTAMHSSSHVSSHSVSGHTETMHSTSMSHPVIYSRPIIGRTYNSYGVEKPLPSYFFYRPYLFHVNTNKDDCKKDVYWECEK